MLLRNALSPLSLLRPLLVATAVLVMGNAALASGYLQTNMVSDGTVGSTITDSNLINPWGIAFGPTTPFWIADNNAGVSTLYNSVGEPVPLVVNIPLPPGQTGLAAPDGIVFNGTTDFSVSETNNGVTKSGAALFIFATEDGTISGWSPGVDLHNAIIAVDQSGSLAVFKGLTSANVNGQNILFATDFRHNQVDMFDAHFNMIGSFTDKTLPAGYAPFGIREVDNFLVVTFAQQDASGHDDTPGAGLGYVDIFTNKGVMTRRVGSQGTLNAPWGIALSPLSFGPFGGDLLIGNFGDGTINAFKMFSSTFDGQLADSNGNVITNHGLWTLTFGNGDGAGLQSVLYFTSGPNRENDGLFGQIQTTPISD